MGERVFVNGVVSWDEACREIEGRRECGGGIGMNRLEGEEAVVRRDA
ncbi:MULTISPECIES: hypothetical protein [unclassified Bartonella]